MEKNNLKCEVLMGNEAIVKGALAAGVDFVSGYPGCPAAEIGDEFEKIAGDFGVYFENSVNEKVALEAAIGACFSGLKSLVNMKSFGLNVCSDALLPLLYTGVKAPMVIVVGDDPNCWSSAQTEQNSRAYSLMAHLPTLEPADCQECYDFTKLSFEISKKFNLPVMIRTTIRVAHQKGPVNYRSPASETGRLMPGFCNGHFEKNFQQYITLPPRVLEMKKELLEKTEKIKTYLEKSPINKIIKSGGHRVSSASGKLGIIVSGVSYLHTMQALSDLNLQLSVLKIGSFYPLPEKKIINFIKQFKQVLVVEELDPFLERELKIIANDNKIKTKIIGKEFLPEIGELNVELVETVIAKILKLRAPHFAKATRGDLAGSIPRRTSRLCEGCPYWYVFPTLKRLAPKDTIFGGDIGCYMMAGLAPHNIQDYLFCMGSSLGIAHGISRAINPKSKIQMSNQISASDKATADKQNPNVQNQKPQKIISLIGDGTFFHSGIPALINAVYNKSSPLVVVLDNGITAMTGHQLNPGDSKREQSQNYGDYSYDWNHGEDGSVSIKIEDVAMAVGVKNIKVLDPINLKEFENTMKDFLAKDELSLIICRRICALLEKRLKK